MIGVITIVLIIIILFILMYLVYNLLKSRKNESVKQSGGDENFHMIIYNSLDHKDKNDDTFTPEENNNLDNVASINERTILKFLKTYAIGLRREITSDSVFIITGEAPGDQQNALNFSPSGTRGFNEDELPETRLKKMIQQCQTMISDTHTHGMEIIGMCEVNEHYGNYHWIKAIFADINKIITLTRKVYNGTQRPNEKLLLLHFNYNFVSADTNNNYLSDNQLNLLENGDMFKAFKDTYHRIEGMNNTYYFMNVSFLPNGINASMTARSDDSPNTIICQSIVHHFYDMCVVNNWAQPDNDYDRNKVFAMRYLIYPIVRYMLKNGNVPNSSDYRIWCQTINSIYQKSINNYNENIIADVQVNPWNMIQETFRQYKDNEYTHKRYVVDPLELLYRLVFLISNIININGLSNDQKKYIYDTDEKSANINILNDLWNVFNNQNVMNNIIANKKILGGFGQSCDCLFVGFINVNKIPGRQRVANHAVNRLVLNPRVNQQQQQQVNPSPWGNNSYGSIQHNQQQGNDPFGINQNNSQSQFDPFANVGNNHNPYGNASFGNIQDNPQPQYNPMQQFNLQQPHNPFNGVRNNLQQQQQYNQQQQQQFIPQQQQFIPPGFTPAGTFNQPLQPLQPNQSQFVPQPPQSIPPGFTPSWKHFSF